jgi:DNA-binding MarR family transcriptional regulator
MKQEGASRQSVHAAIESLQRLTDLFVHRREQLSKEGGLTVAQWAVLEGISDEHFMPSMFARENGSSPSAVSNILKQLRDKGLIAIGVAEGDARQRACRLTAKGRRAMERVRAARERAIAAVWDDLDPEGLRRFTDFSADLIARLEQHAKSEE